MNERTKFWGTCCVPGTLLGLLISMIPVKLTPTPLFVEENEVWHFVLAVDAFSPDSPQPRVDSGFSLLGLEQTTLCLTLFPSVKMSVGFLSAVLGSF